MRSWAGGNEFNVLTPKSRAPDAWFQRGVNIEYSKDK